MIQASNFDGKRICARKMNLAFKDIKRAGADGKCDNGYKSCQGQGKISAANRICIPLDKESEGCPITSIQMIGSSDPRGSNFEYVDFNQDVKLGFSKSIDSLPVTNFHVLIDLPCQSPISESWVFKSTTENENIQNDYMNAIKS